MIAGGLEFGAAQLTEAQQRAGLDAALAVFAEAGITPFQGAYAKDFVESYIEFNCLSDLEEAEEPLSPEEGGFTAPTVEDDAAYATWDRAYEAALAAAGCSEPWRISNLTFRAIPTEVDALVDA